MIQHSAEFLRGAVAALEGLAGVVLFIQIPEIKEGLASYIDNSNAHYRALLAEAEAREAAPDAAAVIAACKAAIETLKEKWVAWPPSAESLAHAQHLSAGVQAVEEALAAVAEWEAGR